MQEVIFRHLFEISLQNTLSSPKSNQGFPYGWVLVANEIQGSQGHLFGLVTAPDLSEKVELFAQIGKRRIYLLTYTA